MMLMKLFVAYLVVVGLVNLTRAQQEGDQCAIGSNKYIYQSGSQYQESVPGSLCTISGFDQERIETCTKLCCTSVFCSCRDITSHSDCDPSNIQQLSIVCWVTTTRPTPVYRIYSCCPNFKHNSLTGVCEAVDPTLTQTATPTTNTPTITKIPSTKRTPTTTTAVINKIPTSVLNDVAVGKSATSSSNYSWFGSYGLVSSSPSFAVNGQNNYQKVINVESWGIIGYFSIVCSVTALCNCQSWWSVDLGDNYAIQNVTVYGYPLANVDLNSASGFFTVYVLNGVQQAQQCGSVNGPLDASRNFKTSINCGGITGQIVKIVKNSNTPSNVCSLLMCDVNVFAYPSAIKTTIASTTKVATITSPTKKV